MKDQDYAATKTIQIRLARARPSTGESRLTIRRSTSSSGDASASERDHHGNRN